MLAGRTEERDVPHAPGHKFTFQTLSARQLDEAEQNQVRGAMRMMAGIDTSAMRQSLEGLQTQRNEADSYDKDTLVRYGVVAWTLEEPCDEENKGKLDARTRNWAAQVVVEMNVRPLASANGTDATS